MNELAHSYAAITKSEKQEDGTLKVYGKATDDTIDIDQQICDESWLKKAMPDWFTTGGNVREQHSNIAAGVATDYELKEDGHYITALVVDPVSVKKVETGVLKGFSIGIRSPRVIRDQKAAGGRIVDGQIVEVSLVDRPANPNAKLMLAKAADNGELVNVAQVNIPSPADVARLVKSDAPADEAVEVEETAPVEEVVVDEVSVDAPAEVEAPDADAEPVEAVSVDEDADTEKSVQGELLKYDDDLYNAAVAAVVALIESETQEIVTEGDDETKDIKQLLKAMKHLQKWHSIEVEKAKPTHYLRTLHTLTKTT